MSASEIRMRHNKSEDRSNNEYSEENTSYKINKIKLESKIFYPDWHFPPDS